MPAAGLCTTPLTDESIACAGPPRRAARYRSGDGEGRPSVGPALYTGRLGRSGRDRLGQPLRPGASRSPATGSRARCRARAPATGRPPPRRGTAPPPSRRISFIPARKPSRAASATPARPRRGRRPAPCRGCRRRPPRPAAGAARRWPRACPPPAPRPCRRRGRGRSPPRPRCRRRCRPGGTCR